MGFIQDQLRKTSVEAAVAADSAEQNASVVAKNALITTGNLLPGTKKPLLPLVVTDEEQKNRVAILKKMGFSNGEQVAYFGAEVDSNPQLKTFFASFEKDFAKTAKYDAVLKKMGAQILADGQKIRFDADAAKGAGTGIIDKLSADLKGKGPEITKQLREKPELFAEKIDGYANGNVSIAEFVADAAVVAAPVVVATAPAAPAAAASGKKKVTTAPATVKPAAAPAAAAPAPAPAEVAAAATAPAQAHSAPSSSSSPASGESADETFARELLSTLASASDEDMKAKIGKPEAKAIAAGLASKAISLGVSSVTADAFKDRIRKDNNLAQAVAQNLQNNPEFVRQLAKLSQDKSVPKGMKQAAMKEMDALMSKPENLASDEYVKGLQDRIKKGKELESMLGKVMGPLKGMMNDFSMMMAGFTGQHSVISMSKGSSFFPTLMINLHNFGRNQDEARAFANYGPSDMTALGKKGADGKFFHTVMEKDANGKEVAVEVPNGQMTLRTASGDTVKVIPSVGVLMAKQEKGSLDVNGNFVPGRIKVPVVDSVNEKGHAASIRNIYMTPTDFAEYKAKVDALGREKGLNVNTLAFQSYTAQDLAEAQQKAGKVQVAQVDPKTGDVLHVTAQPNLLRPVAEPVRQVAGAKAPNSANDRDFSLQA